jgi:hypothetical protein
MIAGGLERGLPFCHSRPNKVEDYMRLLSKTALAAALLGSTLAAPVFAAAPDATGCPPGMHRADSQKAGEAGGVGSVNAATRKAEGEGGGVGSVNAATRKAEGEGGGVGSVNAATRKAEGEGGGVGSVNAATRKAEAEVPSTACIK